MTDFLPGTTLVANDSFAKLSDHNFDINES